MSYIQNKNEFDNLVRLVKPLIGWNSHADNGKKIYYSNWYEYQNADGFHFLSFISRLMEASHDDEVYYYEIEDGFLAKYVKYFNRYPIIKITPPFTHDNFVHFLKENYAEVNGNSSDVIAFASNYILFPPSLNWYIYGEYDVELSKLVTNLALPERTDGIPYFITEQEAQEKIKLLG